jgi:hypothetical protein
VRKIELRGLKPYFRTHWLNKDFEIPQILITILEVKFILNDIDNVYLPAVLWLQEVTLMF